MSWQHRADEFGIGLLDVRDHLTRLVLDVQPNPVLLVAACIAFATTGSANAPDTSAGGDIWSWMPVSASVPDASNDRWEQRVGRRESASLMG
jgi:hypothetical protein